MRALDLLLTGKGESRDVQIDITVCVADGMGGADPFGGSGGAGSAALVVATFVSAQGLSSGKGLMADGALVEPASAGGCGGGGGRSSTGDVGGSVLILILMFGGEFPMTGLVTTESLVRGEGLVANRASVSSG